HTAAIEDQFRGLCTPTSEERRDAFAFYLCTSRFLFLYFVEIVYYFVHSLPASYFYNSWEFKIYLIFKYLL
ncbi:hypothetical protein EJ08DRAFT_735803, partial [Tothia fuscella]